MNRGFAIDLFYLDFYYPRSFGLRLKMSHLQRILARFRKFFTQFLGLFLTVFHGFVNRVSSLDILRNLIEEIHNLFQEIFDLIKSFFCCDLPFEKEKKLKHDFNTPVITIAFLITQTIGLIASLQDQKAEYSLKTETGTETKVIDEGPLLENLVYYVLGAIVLFGVNMGIMRAKTQSQEKLLFNLSTRRFTSYTLGWIVFISTSSVIAAYIGFLPGQTGKKELVRFGTPKPQDIQHHTFKTTEFETRNGLIITTTLFVERTLGPGKYIPIEVKLQDDLHEDFYIATAKMFKDRLMKEKAILRVDIAVKLKRRSVKMKLSGSEEKKTYYLQTFIRPRSKDVGLEKTLAALRTQSNTKNQFIFYGLYDPKKNNSE